MRQYREIELEEDKPDFNNNRSIGVKNGFEKAGDALLEDSLDEVNIMKKKNLKRMTSRGEMAILEKPKTKERTVAYVIEKVAQWRRLYNGYYD